MSIITRYWTNQSWTILSSAARCSTEANDVPSVMSVGEAALPIQDNFPLRHVHGRVSSINPLLCCVAWTLGDEIKERNVFLRAMECFKSFQKSLHRELLGET